MANAKWSPSPWQDEGRQDDGSIRIADAGGAPVALVVAGEHQEANRHVIKGSTELYEALVEIVDSTRGEQIRDERRFIRGLALGFAALRAAEGRAP